MTLTVEPIIQVAPNARGAEILARLLTIDGFPAIAQSGPIGGEVHHIVATLAPYAHYKLAVQVARIFSKLNDTDLAETYRRGELMSRELHLPTLDEPTFKVGMELLKVGLALVFDEAAGDPGDEESATTKPDFVVLVDGDAFDTWKPTRTL